MEFEKLKKIIASILGVDPDEITKETTFSEDLGADSLDVYQIIIELEETYGIVFTNEMVEKIKNVGEAVSLIKNTIDLQQ